MDNKRRGKLRDITRTLYRLAGDVEALCDKEQDCVDNYPESLQETDRYSQMEDAVDELTEATSSINDAIEHIEAAIHG